METFVFSSNFFLWDWSHMETFVFSSNCFFQNWI